MKIATIENYPNEDVKSFHVREKVVLGPEYKPEYYDNLKGCQNRIVLKLFEIYGVVKVILKPYEVVIHKAKSYEWSEIEATIHKILEEN